MTERECKIQMRKCDVRAAEIKLQEKREKMQLGIEEAKAVYHAKVAALKMEWQVAQVDLEREKAYLTEAEEGIG